jgi:hypothetical protein
MNTVSTFNILDEDDHKNLFVTLLSNGGDDLPKLGVGKDERGVFIVDLEPDENPIKIKTYVKRGLDVLDVVKIGVRTEVFQEWASDDIRFRVDEDLQGEWDNFCNAIFEEV